MVLYDSVSRQASGRGRCSSAGVLTRLVMLKVETRAGQHAGQATAVAFRGRSEQPGDKDPANIYLEDGVTSDYQLQVKLSPIFIALVMLPFDLSTTALKAELLSCCMQLSNLEALQKEYESQTSRNTESDPDSTAQKVAALEGVEGLPLRKESASDAYKSVLYLLEEASLATKAKKVCYSMSS